jgi:hypothetical protein
MPAVEPENNPYLTKTEREIFKQDKIIKDPEMTPFPTIPIGPSTRQEGVPQIPPYIPSYEKTPQTQKGQDKLLLDLQVYQDPKKTNPLADKQARLPIQPIALSSPFMPPQFSTYLSNFMKNFYTPFIYKDYHIKIGGPTGDRSFASMIYEDAMPTLNVYYSYKTLRDRNNLVDYIRSNFIKVSEGEFTNFDGGSNSLNSRLKLIKLGPFDSNTWTANPYYNMPKGFEIFSSCYPIVADKQDLTAKCKKNSVGINLRFYQISHEELIAKYPNYKPEEPKKTISIEVRNILNPDQFNIWREIKYYEYIRINIDKGYISPNFIQSYCYFLYTDAKFDYSKNSRINPNELTNSQKEALVVSDKHVVLLTESPNMNLIKWTSNLYEIDKNVRKQIYSGFKPQDVWEPVVFQMLTIFYLMDKNEFTFTDMNLINNFFIKDLGNIGDTGNQYWIYRINNIDYYVPCKGDLLLLDSDYHDIDNNSKNKKIISSKIFDDDPVKVKNIIRENANKCFNSDYFTSIQLKGTLGVVPPPAYIIALFDVIRNGLNDVNKSYEDIILEYFLIYTHNRVGTMIRDNEKDYILKNDVKPFSRGELVIYESKYETYEIVLYLKNIDEYSCECVSRKINRDGKNVVERININKDMLYHYSEREFIKQDVLPGQPAISSDDLIETYIF